MASTAHTSMPPTPPPAKETTGPIPKRALVLFAILYLLALGILTSLFLGILKVEADQRLAALQVREAGKAAVASHLLDQDFEVTASDLRVLANAPSTRRYLESGSPADRNAITAMFLNMAQAKPAYDQIRYLDTTGMEIVRVDSNAGKPAAVPDGKLQNKGGRYFFTDSLKLAAGEIYVSPLDLNIEHGQIERPFKPMLRFGTPVFDRAGHKKGVIIINVYGRGIIEHFLEAMGGQRHAMLINRDGDWLSSPDPSLAWGFMFGRPHAFADRYPAEWRRIVADEAGGFVTGAGLFTYATTYPLKASQRSSTGSPLASGGSSRDLEQREYFWKVVSFLPAAELPSASLSRHPHALASYIVGALLLAVLTGYIVLTVTSRRQWRRAVFENETRLREITSTLGEGVYVLDAQGLITYVNPEAERLLGWDRTALLGQHAHNLFHHHLADGTPLPESECAINRVVQSGQVYRNEDESFWRKDGSRMPVSVCSSPIIREDRIAGSVVAFTDITERKRQQDEIHRLAYYDPLTNLPNRRLLLERLHQSLIQARRYRRSLAVMFLDLDHFKEINDTLGHDIGDALLKAVAARLAGCIRGGDTVARQGGDEFVILLAEIAEPGDAAGVAEKLLRALRDPVPLAGHELRATVSIGISIYPVDGTDDAQELMRKADIAMYAAKQAGRNRYCFHGATPCGAAPD
jgi:diguanylate cyclase (GGDEF)-like protein/PAS domain S-box-containing protein